MSMDKIFQLKDIMQKRVHVIFSGMVQGVGFRCTSESIAASLGVSGWVKNVSGGEVEIMAEQEEGILNDFLRRLEDEFGGYIKDKQVDWFNATGEFKGFQIRF